jgi:hypothetical protein
MPRPSFLDQSLRCRPVQRICHGHCELFYDDGKPKDEVHCRNTLLDLLGPTLPFGIVWAPEEQMLGNKRADAGFLRVALEA